MSAKFDIKLDAAFETQVNVLDQRVKDTSRRAMQHAMEVVGELTQAMHRAMSGTDHQGTYATWLLPGIYPDEHEHRRFRWESTGLTEKSIQGYAVGVGKPEDVGSVTDSFGRVHDSAAASVAPIPYDLANDTNVVGVLTMTTSYAPADSQSGATEVADGFSRFGVQAFEAGGSWDHHMRGGEHITVLGLQVNQPALEFYLAGHLIDGLVL